MKRHRLIGLAVALLVAAAGLPASATVASARDTYHEFNDIGTFMCLQPLGGSTLQGVAIVLEPCDGSLAQLWSKVPVHGSIVHYRNQLSGLCLDARGGASNGTPVQQWTCNQISNENWEEQYVTPDDEPFAVFVRSRVSGTRSHCLDIPWNQAYPGAAMQLARCNGTVAQQWVAPSP